MSNQTLPTVDQLFQVFKDNNWKGSQTDGAGYYYISQGRCCAIPAFIKHYKPDMIFTENTEFYKIVSDLIGETGMNNLWRGFDEIESKAILSASDMNTPEYKLGKQLAEKLKQKGMMVY